jgi:serine phosphatase RsbU (regulator of sigma subunit)
LTKTGPGASVLGIMPGIHASETTIEFSPTSELYLFTDGLYELLDPQGGRGSYDEFLAYLDKQVHGSKPAWDAILSRLDHARDGRMMDDDVTLLRFATRE